MVHGAPRGDDEQRRGPRHAYGVFELPLTIFLAPRGGALRTDGGVDFVKFVGGVGHGWAPEGTSLRMIPTENPSREREGAFCKSEPRTSVSGFNQSWKPLTDVRGSDGIGRAGVGLNKLNA